jgi:hypothetical protein
VLRSREDSDYDVLARANNFCVENNTQRAAVFHVQKEEAGADAIHSVFADGHPYPHEVKDQRLIFSMTIPQGATRCIAVQHGKDVDLSSVATGHDSSEAYFLRMASDFRDIYLSRSPGGLAFIRFYNEHGISPAELLVSVFAFMLLLGCGTYYVRKLAGSKHHTQARPHTFVAKTSK